MRIQFFRPWPNGKGYFEQLSQWTLYALTTDAPTREWRERANEAGFSAHFFLRKRYAKIEKVMALSLRASPLMNMITKGAA